jgi:hypothetical protein
MSVNFLEKVDYEEWKTVFGQFDFTKGEVDELFRKV